MAKTRTSAAGTKGFTLLELIIVLFIAGMSMAVVIFSAGRMHEKAIFNDEARRICQTMKHAREISLMERADIAVKFDEEKNSYWIDYGNEKTSDRHTLHEGLTLSGKEIVFYPKGSCSGGTIKIKNDKGQEYAIEVDPILGMPKIKRV